MQDEHSGRAYARPLNIAGFTVLHILQDAGLLVEGVDQLIQILSLSVNGVPGSLGVIPQGVQLFYS